jgi:hypothetical protein
MIKGWCNMGDMRVGLDKLMLIFSSPFLVDQCTGEAICISVQRVFPVVWGLHKA